MTYREKYPQVFADLEEMSKLKIVTLTQDDILTLKLGRDRIKTMLGKEIEFQDEGIGVIADETEDSIYIVSGFFTGWMYKAEYFELLGTE